MAAKKRGYWLERHRPSRHSSAWWWLACLVGLGVLGWVFWREALKQSIEPVTPQPVPAPVARRSTHPNPTVTSPSNAALPRLPLTNVIAPPAQTNPPPHAALPATNKLKTPLPATNAPILTNQETIAIAPAPEWPRPVQNLLEAQIALARQGISAGPIDGVVGSQTRAALRVYQQQHSLPQTGNLDAATRLQLTLDAPPCTNYTISSADLSRIMTIPHTWLGKSEQSRLDFESILELVAEKARSHPALIRRLNPDLTWNEDMAPGTLVVVPSVENPAAKAKASYVRIHLGAKTLEAFGTGDRLLAHFPCSIARQVEKRPIGQLNVVAIARNPNYVFNPEVFPESAEARQLGRKLILPPGPNNPVGVAWIGLDKSGYGIHGTPKPEEVGRTESHGCFRLANWNAEYLAQLVSVGTPVFIDP